jgi:HD-GYP domain-containing protein (c-di-GMP phosphodiesterase class II)
LQNEFKNTTIYYMAENKAYHVQNKELLFAFRFLAEAIDARDPYTLGHMNRVARYCMKILDQLPGKSVKSCLLPHFFMMSGT